MRTRNKDMIGRVFWYARNKKSDYTSTSGMDDCWYDRDATLEELQKACPPNQTFEYFYREAYVKAGRSMARIIDKKYELIDGTWVTNEGE